MWNRTLLVVLCLFVIGNLEKVRTESYNQELDCLEHLRDNNRYNIASYKLCELLDRETDPCDDFYRFACGKYIDSKNGSGNDDNSIQLDVEQRNKRFLINFLKHSNHKRNVYQFDVYLAIDFYKSCMNRDKQGLQTMAKVIDNYGGWPVVRGQNWNKSNCVTLNINEDFDMAPILNIKYMPAKENQPESFSLALPTFFIWKDKLLKNSGPYFELMVEVAVEFGAEKSFAEIEMRKVLEFELDLIKNYKKPAENDSLTINEMRLQYPEIMKFIQPFIEYHATIHGDIKFDLSFPKYFKYLESKLPKTSEKTIANYLIWHVILTASQYLTLTFAQRVMRGVNEVMGLPAEKLISYDNVCFDYVKTFLPLSLDTIYIEAQTELSDSKKAAINKIKIKMRNEIIKMVQESEWLDDGAKNQLIEKLEAMYIWIWNRKRYSELRELFIFNLEIDSDNFFHNILQIKKYHRKHPLAKSYHMSMPSWYSDAQYTAYENTIFMPAGILQWPQFEIDAPLYVNYGGLGSLIGHEIGHAIDERNHKINKFGKLSDWLNSTENEYKIKSECFMRQYSEMETENGLKLNGSKTINEDICDNLGVKAAYKAYRSLTEANEQLPGLWNYTHRQLFWISMAQTYCGFTEPSHYSTLIDSYDHTLRQYRVLGVIKNMPDFARDFNCSLYKKMNSETYERCELW